MKKIITITLLMFAMTAISSHSFASPPNFDHPDICTESFNSLPVIPFMKIEVVNLPGVYFPSFDQEKMYCLTTIYSGEYSPQNLLQIKRTLDNKYQQIPGSNNRWKSKDSNIYIEAKKINQQIQVMYHIRS